MKASLLEAPTYTSARDESPELFADLDTPHNPEASLDAQANRALGSLALQEVRALPELSKLGAMIDDAKERLDRITPFKTADEASKWLRDGVYRIRDFSMNDAEKAQQLQDLGVHCDREMIRDGREVTYIDTVGFTGLNGSFSISSESRPAYLGECYSIDHISSDGKKRTTVRYTKMKDRSGPSGVDAFIKYYDGKEYLLGNDGAWHETSLHDVATSQRLSSRKVRKYERRFAMLAQQARDDLNSKIEAVD